jgi:hypothetical protein
VLAVLLCLTSLMMSTSQGQTSGSASLTSSGLINYPSNGGKLLFQSSFEEPPTIVNSGGEYYLGNFATSTYIAFENGGTAWIEDKSNPKIGAPTPHSGRYCFALKTLAGAGVPLRSEALITHIDGTQGMGGIGGLNLPNQFYVSLWLYMPSNWTITGTSTNYWWYELLDILVLNGGGYPRYCAMIRKQSNGQYKFDVEYNTGAGAGTPFRTINPFTLPLGEWFNCRWFITEATSGGRIQFWLTTSTYNNELFDSITVYPNGIPTKASGGPPEFNFIKNYLNGQDSNNPSHVIWVDDIEVWDDLP